VRLEVAEGVKVWMIVGVVIVEEAVEVPVGTRV
jgi:hypothetical protein